MSTTILSTHQERVDALVRLLEIAQRGAGQSRVVAHFLMGLYNGQRFKFDLTDFRLLDESVFDDCLLVLVMDQRPVSEVHTYFENGGKVWEQMARDWNIRDYTKRAPPRART